MTSAHSLLVIAKSLAAHFGITRSLKQVSDDLSYHPKFPNIDSLIHVLKSWNIFALIVEVPLVEIKSLQIPFIISVGQTDWRLILNKEDAIAEESTTTRRHPADSETQENACLAILFSKSNSLPDGNRESLTTSITKNYLATFVIWSVVLLIAYIALSTDALRGTLIILNSIGAYVAHLASIPKESRGSFARQVCKLSGSDCSTLLSSNFAKPFGFISLSILGFSYFVSIVVTLLYSLVARDAQATVQAIYYFELAATLVCLCTLSFQTIRRSWCALCVAMACIVFTSFTLFFVSGVRMVARGQLMNSIPSLLLILLLMSAIAILSDRVHHFLEHSARAKAGLGKWLYLKNNSNVLDGLLRQQPSLDRGFTVVPANISAEGQQQKVSLVLVVDTRCGPCLTAYDYIESIYMTFKNYLGLKVILLNHTEPSNALQNGSMFRTSLPDETRTSEVSEEDISEFIRINKIVTTPALFVNGFRWPDVLELEDLKYYLSDKIYA